MSSHALLTARVLNRLAYRPTPDELERVAAIGPQAFIDEQLAPENLKETMDTTVYTVSTNGGDLVFFTHTGNASRKMVFIYFGGGGGGGNYEHKFVGGGGGGGGR